MRRAPWFSLLLILLSLVVQVSSIDDSYVQCERVVNKWAKSSAENVKREDKLTLRDLLFFLHIPRTGGRTYFQCFLKKLYSFDQECARSYDKIRFNPSKPNCNVVATHDDYSLISKLPQDKTSVVTILRDPIERVFSTYEFAVEVAARFLVHPNLTSALETSNRVRRKSSTMVSTLDIWPWKYLVPWMREDLFARREASKLGKLKRNVFSDVYNTEDVAMPLHEFINHPAAHELIHNGITFQVAGLTNNSYLDDAHEVRQCVRKHPSLGQLVLGVAKGRLDQMLYVGLTEDHKKSARMFASMVGAQILARSKSTPDSQPESSEQTDVESVQAVPEKPVEENNHTASIEDEVSTANANPPKKILTEEQLMEEYQECVENLRNAQMRRRYISLKRIYPVNFTSQARGLVPEPVLEEMRNLNRLDMQLYLHAQSIFMQQQILMDNLEKQNLQLAKQVSAEIEAPWNYVLLLMVLVPVFLFFMVVMHRRRTSKLKI
ncbi:Sulfotransferase [Rhynchospora pubera]|uniref:Sulfotransferase n=1 Tax=Rhynchospora pubera TaxID=906938 RepID=A0AAV8EDK0_9POAL|nr:Sulfotransferase [Rhynchospora pubera]KAJ4785647.1 Sulfotransferase [Rhynchospora pubera]